MDVYNALRERFRRDDAVSPVIAVILMVAITVVLAATVYVWVSGFASDTSGPEQASATAEGATVGSGNSSVNWIRVSLTNGDGAPYGEDQVSYTVLDNSGNSFSADQSGDDVLCVAAKAWQDTGGTGNSFCYDEDFHDDDEASPATNEWSVGGVLYVPCQGDGEHSITISVKDTTILDATVDCDTQA